MTAPVLVGRCGGCGQVDIPVEPHIAHGWSCTSCAAASAHALRRRASRGVTSLGWVSTNSVAGSEHKIADAEHKVASGAVLDRPAAVDTGSFSGYLAVVGNRDRQGDTIMRGALDATVAEFNVGGQRWLITDSHSDFGADVVAEVKTAVVDSHGLKVTAVWMPGPKAQALRAMAKAGAGLGLSIDYLARRSRPDGQGGRLLDAVDVIGAAITPKPANPLAMVVEGKGLPWPGDADAQLTALESWAETAAGYAARDTLAGMVSNPDSAIAALGVLSRAQDDAAQAQLGAWLQAQPPAPTDAQRAEARRAAARERLNADSYELQRVMAADAGACPRHPGLRRCSCR